MPRWLRLWTFALVCALAASACGGGGGGGGTNAGDKIPGVVIEHAPGRGHVNGPIQYTGKLPPSGGNHNPVPLTCGYYDQQPPNEYAVHSLEHGAVWIAYGPSNSPADVATLRAFAKHDKVIVSPYAGLDAPVVLVAWERRLEVQSAGDPRVQQFVDAFASGSQSPERTSACTGVGQPAT